MGLFIYFHSFNMNWRGGGRRPFYFYWTIFFNFLLLLFFYFKNIKKITKKRLITTYTGKKFWGEVNYTQKKGNGQNYIDFIIRDIDKEERMRLAVKESEYQYRLLAENVSDLISRHSLDGTTIYVSPSCYKVLGYKADELLGSSAYELIHPEDIAKIIDISDKDKIKFF